MWVYHKILMSYNEYHYKATVYTWKQTACLQFCVAAHVISQFYRSVS